MPQGTSRVISPVIASFSASHWSRAFWILCLVPCAIGYAELCSGRTRPSIHLYLNNRTVKYNTRGTRRRWVVP
ncbi:hypothetical protein DFH29DRAFT_926620 [Suillus ampliporus]|nr:hypothetical protein DFH29DRAFT_926620 [Suillus ampliporus]